jgi:hypothetical protein
MTQSGRRCDPAGGKAMAEQAGGPLLKFPGARMFGPKLQELAVSEPSPDTHHRVVPGDFVAPDATEHMRSAKSQK